MATSSRLGSLTFPKVLHLVPPSGQGRGACKRVTPVIDGPADPTSEIRTRGSWRRGLLKVWRFYVASPHILIYFFLSCGAGERVVHRATEVLIENGVTWTGRAPSHEVALRRANINYATPGSTNIISTGARHLAL